MKTKNHYTLGDRMAIKDGLDNGKSIKEIVKDTKKSSSGIVKEIEKHHTCKYFQPFNSKHPCLKWATCNVRGTECYLTCRNIEYKLCPKLEKSPHVCNGCTTKNGCHMVKRYYDATTAHEMYKDKLSTSRIGLHYTEIEFTILKERLCPLIINCKSVYHAITTINNVLDTNFNLKTIYRQIKGNYLPISSSDLPRSRRKSKQNNDTNYKRDIKGHTYDDYNDYKKTKPNATEVQMDTVEGIKENNAPAILTLEIVNINFLFMFKIDRPLKIYDLAKRLLKLTNSDGIEIKEIGIRKGEKIYEEFPCNDENCEVTENKKILRVSVPKFDEKKVDGFMKDFWTEVQSFDKFRIVSKLKEMIPEYVSNNSEFTNLDKRVR